MSNVRSICVFCSSSDATGSVHFDVARALGRIIGERGHRLVYGGARVGPMGALAKATQAGGGHVVGVIPERLRDRGVAYEAVNELIVPPSMHKRKATMEDLADAFVCLPGGFGTLEEMLEVIVLKQLGYHCKPVVLVNCDGFYDRLLALFEQLYAQRIAKPSQRKLYHVATDATDAIDYVERYKPETIETKFFAL